MYPPNISQPFINPVRPPAGLHFEVKNTERMNNTQQVQLAGKMTSFSTALPGLNLLASQRPDIGRITVEVTPQGDQGRIEKTGPGGFPMVYSVARTYYESFSDFLYRLVQS